MRGFLMLEIHYLAVCTYVERITRHEMKNACCSVEKEKSNSCSFKNNL